MHTVGRSNIDICIQYVHAASVRVWECVVVIAMVCINLAAPNTFYIMLCIWIQFTSDGQREVSSHLQLLHGVLTSSASHRDCMYVCISTRVCMHLNMRVYAS